MSNVGSPEDEPPKLAHEAPPWFHDRWDALREWLLRWRVLSGVDIEITDAGRKGKSVNVKKQRKEFLRPPPFQPFVNKLIGPDLQRVSKVEIKLSPGTILKTVRWDDIVTISGIDDSKEMEKDEYAWFQVDVNAGGELTAITLKVGVPADEGWSDFPEAYKMLNPGTDRSQTWWHLICRLRQLGAEEDKPIACVLNGREVCTFDVFTTTNLIFRYDCAPDATEQRIRLLAPWTGGFAGD